MKIVAAVALMCLMSAGAWADGPSCSAQSTDKHLAGAAKSSFMKRCTADAQKSCDASAADKHLAGAAKSSFSKKCVKDAVG